MPIAHNQEGITSPLFLSYFMVYDVFMNIHPIVVHFPIAFLMIYGMCELIRFKIITGKPYWFYIKAFLAIVGILSAFAAYQAGDAIEHQFEAEYGNVMRVHADFAVLSIIIFGIAAASYFVAWVNRVKSLSWPLWGLATRIQKLVLETPIVIILAVAGLVAISITGALGAAIAHGTDSDIFVRFIYRMFF